MTGSVKKKEEGLQLVSYNPLLFDGAEGEISLLRNHSYANSLIYNEFFQRVPLKWHTKMAHFRAVVTGQHMSSGL